MKIYKVLNLITNEIIDLKGGVEFRNFCLKNSLHDTDLYKTRKNLTDYKGFRLIDKYKESDVNLDLEVLSSVEVHNLVDAMIDTIYKDKNVLIISDLHAPFTLDGYLEFCKTMYNKYTCEEVVIIGDIIDNHYSSYHETDPSGFGADHELDKAKLILKGFYDAFPNAKVVIGNHDRIVLRKAFTSGVSKQWIKDMKAVLEVPSWEFNEYFIINDILFYHGEGANPKSKCKQEFMSCVAGHRHSETYIEFYQNRQEKRIFAMQVGTGINQDAYAFAYNKFGKPSHVNVGVIWNGVPIIEYTK